MDIETLKLMREVREERELPNKKLCVVCQKIRFNGCPVFLFAESDSAGWREILSWKLKSSVNKR